MRKLISQIFSNVKLLITTVIGVILLVVVAKTVFYSLIFSWRSGSDKWQTVLESLDTQWERSIDLNRYLAPFSPGGEKCHYYNCFNVYKCGRMDNGRIQVYVYPAYKYVDKNGQQITNHLSTEYKQMISAIIKSPYYTSNPDNACLFIAAIDTLNQNNINTKNIEQVYSSLPFWDEGRNHLIFTMLPSRNPEADTLFASPSGNMMLASSGVSSVNYRRGFDISIPVYNPLTAKLKLQSPGGNSRKWLVVSSQGNIQQEYRQELLDIAEEHPELLILDKCLKGEFDPYARCRGKSTMKYPDILTEGTFCLIIRGPRLSQMVLFDVMKAGCIPILVADGLVLPFSEVVDWNRASLQVYEHDLGSLISIVKSVSTGRVEDMRQQVAFLYEKYFSSPQTIALTTLHIINDRVFPHLARTYEDWNEAAFKDGARNPLFLPMIAPRSQGFTAVVLTYDRVDSLFRVVSRIAKTPSLSKIIVVWNNQIKRPPPAQLWPKITKPLKVIQTRENKLSNRFFPYDEIETEAILALDDDIIMLTPDELEFGFEVWREFPDRIVGFPSRVHLWDNSTGRYKYESEWTNSISMVLTGAAFYHKYWNHMYTTSMPKGIKDWVDNQMNCEDIAMNFLVTNMTRKAPIKVAPRKKFKCPECVNTEMLSADLSHLMERSECVNQFTKMYGMMPLKAVEFRADPVLFKDPFPDKLKRFKDIGSL